MKNAADEPITDYRITDHAAFEVARRGIDESVVRSVLAAPDQRHQVRPGRDVLQSRLAIAEFRGHPSGIPGT